MDKATILAGVLMALASIMPSKANQREGFKARVTRILETKSGLQCEMGVQKDRDGGAYAVLVSIKNPADHRAVTIVTNEDLTAAILIAVSDDQGKTISKPLKKFRTDEVQHFVSTELSASGHREWLVPLSSWIDPKDLAISPLKARLVVTLAFKYKGKDDPESALEDAICTLYETELSLSKTALEGDAATKYKARSIRP